jgi:hypothetical protein
VAPENNEPVGDSWEALRDQAVAALDVLIQEMKDAQTDLRANQTAFERNRSHLSAGGRASDMTELFDIPSLRSTLTDRLAHVEQARMATRRSLWKMQIAEGATIADVARAWGLSRQLVSRALANDEPTVSD